MEWFAVALLAGWFTATLFYQLFFHRLISVAGRWDVFRVVPSWRLYIKVPQERRIYIRDRDADGNIGAWREIPLRLSRRPGRACFNPDLRETDAILSLIEFVCDAALSPSPPSPDSLRNSVGWRGIWLVVSTQPAESAATVAARQFEIRQLRLSGDAAEELIYASEFLPLLAGGETP